MAVLAGILVAFACQWCAMEEGPGEGARQQIIPQLPWVRLCKEGRATHRGDCPSQREGSRQLCYGLATCHQSGAQGRDPDQESSFGQACQDGTVEQLGFGAEAHFREGEGPLPDGSLPPGKGGGGCCSGAGGRTRCLEEGGSQHGSGLGMCHGRTCRCWSRVRRPYAGRAWLGGVSGDQRGHLEEDLAAGPWEKGDVERQRSGSSDCHHSAPEKALDVQPGCQHAIAATTCSAAQGGSENRDQGCVSLAWLYPCGNRSLYGLSFYHFQAVQSSKWSQKGGYTRWGWKGRSQGGRETDCSATYGSGHPEACRQAGGEAFGLRPKARASL